VEIIQDCYVIVNDEGDIVDVVDLSATRMAPDEILIGHGIKGEDVVKLGKDEALIPGFIDVHLHAPQYSYTGTATDRPLMEWLTHYTFPAESSHADDLAWAEEVYSKLVKRLLANGTTTAVYFATLHAQPTMLLADICFNLGQRAFIGKVNMDRNSPDNYIESTDESISATELVISHIRSKGSPEMLIPIITPRFVPTCTPGMLPHRFT
jgi:guanine deaminase